MKTNKIVALALAVILALSLMTTAFAAFKGDVDSNGTINSSDALAVLKYSVELITEIDEKVADMDANGVINSSDALAILRISVGLDEKEELPTEPDTPEEPDIPDTPDTPDVPDTPDTPEVPDVPTSTEEIVALYNNAVNKVVDDKAGYTKERTTTVTKIDAGSYTSVASGIVKDFLGEGTNEFKNNKGTAKYFEKSALTVSDVKSATCELKGNNYTITLNLNDGTSSATKSSKEDSSAVAKCGLLTGKIVNTDIDYINSECIYASITAEKINVEKITAENTNAKIVIVVDANTGNMISYTASFDWNAEIKNLSTGSGFLAVSIKKATGKAHTALEISDFQW